MNNIFLIIILVILFVILMINKFCQKENFELKLNDKITFELKKSPELNLIFFDSNLYFTNNSPYIFNGILDTNGLYQLRDSIKNYNFILNYNVSNTSNSHVTLESPDEDNPSPNTVSNLFNQTNKNIYLDPINKVLVSNDNFGNKVYLTYFADESPVNWDYNISNAVVFEINYL